VWSPGTCSHLSEGSSRFFYRHWHLLTLAIGQSLPITRKVGVPPSKAYFNPRACASPVGTRAGLFSWAPTVGSLSARPDAQRPGFNITAVSGACSYLVATFDEQVPFHALLATPSFHGNRRARPGNERLCRSNHRGRQRRPAAQHLDPFFGGPRCPSTIRHQGRSLSGLVSAALGARLSASHGPTQLTGHMNEPNRTEQATMVVAVTIFVLTCLGGLLVALLV
jgi:hypothetical protein